MCGPTVCWTPTVYFSHKLSSRSFVPEPGLEHCLPNTAEHRLLEGSPVLLSSCPLRALSVPQITVFFPWQSCSGHCWGHPGDRGLGQDRTAGIRRGTILRVTEFWGAVSGEKEGWHLMLGSKQEAPRLYSSGCLLNIAFQKGDPQGHPAGQRARF